MKSTSKRSHLGHVSLAAYLLESWLADRCCTAVPVSSVDSCRNDDRCSIVPRTDGCLPMESWCILCPTGPRARTGMADVGQLLSALSPCKRTARTSSGVVRSPRLAAHQVDATDEYRPEDSLEERKAMKIGACVITVVISPRYFLMGNES